MAVLRRLGWAAGLIIALNDVPSVQALSGMGGSAALGMAISAAGDKISLRKAAGLDKIDVSSVVETPDSPYATFNEVMQMSSFVAALESLTANEDLKKQAEAYLSASEYAAYVDLARHLSKCYGSLSPAGGPLADTWTSGVRSTTQGQAAVLAVDGSVNKLSTTPVRKQQAMKAALGLYDTWIKTGSPSRRLKRISPRHHRAQQGLSDGGWSQLPAPLTGAYDALKGYGTVECRTAYQRMSEMYNSGEIGGNNGGLNNIPGTGGNGGGLPGSGGSMPGSGGGMPGSGSQGGFPNAGSLPGNPFGTSMSGKEPGAEGPPNPFDNPDVVTDPKENPLGGATTTEGNDQEVPTPTSKPTATLAEVGTNKCEVLENGAVSVQLCQGSTVTASSATITGSIINVGNQTLCGLKLIVDNFELASSFYPPWLPSYAGEFQAGNTITFGITVPYTSGAPRPQADIDQSIAACVALTMPPTDAPTLVTASPTRSPTARPAPTEPPGPVFDLLALDGQDTKCLKGCSNIVHGLTSCEAFDAIFAFRCDVCDKDTQAQVKEICRSTFECGNAMCHLVGTEQQHLSSGAGRLRGDLGSVKTSLSLMLGLAMILMMLNMHDG
ncbi:hypothetical protein NSK_007400 [Nannochloropsis salina CCMP1776]|uniref:Uncharacterized protein n=1 Tax=Nannochloropsis salina CCMP1776 TaxID=1027361 RepID=A0A4D9CY49_9STRA|nr:hypothetical protein NSK_007400 [Nannochloropsis salina CCMP1776]|eukprot:TFJ81439.1 hypothetical protein NSK_007400 [Nannochloropsis salina CCMP1776]